MSKPVRGLFISGTDTEVGKTYVACLIARQLVSAGHRVGVYKPLASGCRLEAEKLVSEDALLLWQAAGCPAELSHVCPQRFTAAVSPHLAAQAEGRAIDTSLLHRGLDVWRDQSDIVLIEGAGGLMSPVVGDLYMIDLASQFGFPLVIVSRNALGTIHHTLSAEIVVRTRAAELPIAGIVLNQPDPRRDDASLASNLPELQSRCQSQVLAEVGWRSEQLDRDVDWFALAETRPAGTR